MKINKKIRMILLSTALVFGSMFLTACQDGKDAANSKDQTQTSQKEPTNEKPLMKILRQTMKRIVRTSHPKTRARTKRTQARPNKPR